MENDNSRNEQYEENGGHQDRNQYGEQQRYQNNANYQDNMGDQFNNKGRFDKFRGGLANNVGNSNYDANQYDRDSSRDYNYTNNRRNQFRSRSRSGGRGYARYDNSQNGQRGDQHDNNQYVNERPHRDSNSASSLQIQKRNEIDQTRDDNHFTSTFRQSRQIFVGNMPFTVTKNQFKESFKEFGDILEICMLKDERSGKFNGRGTILFEQKDACKNAVRVMDQAKFNERVVLVKEDEVLHTNYQQHQYDERNPARASRNNYDTYHSRDADLRTDNRPRDNRNNYSRNETNFYKAKRSNSFGENQMGNNTSGGNGGYRERNMDNRDFNQRNRHNNQNKY